MRLIAGLENCDAGSIEIDGTVVNHYTPAQRNVAMVFQQYSLYPHLSVRDNLAFPLRSPILKTPEDEITRKVNEVAEILHIPNKLDNKATELSGGEMQRVSIGRALVRDPAIFLMDEPLSSLDAKLRADLRVELKRLQAEMKKTLLYVTHDQIEAMTMASQIGVLDEGRLVQFGTPRDIYQNPTPPTSQRDWVSPALIFCRRVCLEKTGRKAPPKLACDPKILKLEKGVTLIFYASNIWAIRLDFI